MPNILDNFDYQNKSVRMKLADDILSPLRGLAKGRTIRCIQKEDDTLLFKVTNSKSGSPSFVTTLARIAQVAVTILTSPVLIGALIYKAAVKSATKQNYIDRFEKAQNPQEGVPVDQIEEREILENSWLFRLTKNLTDQSKYSELHQSSHVLGDKAMSKDYARQGVGRFQGGLFFQSANMLRNELAKYVDDEQIGPDITEAKQKMEEYCHWSSRFLGIMPGRFVKLQGINHLVQDLASDLKNRLESLKEGETFLVPVNIRPGTGGFHTITARFKKLENEKIELKIYNLGLGLENHPSLNTLNPENPANLHKFLTNSYYIAPFSIQNIDLEDLSIDFLKGFVDHATFKNNDVDCGKFYRFLTNSFEGKVSEQDLRVVPQDKSQYKLKQSSGTCIWKSPMAALRDSMPLTSYKEFVLKMKRDKWWNLYQKYQGQKNVNSFDQRDAKKLIAVGKVQLENAMKKLAELNNKTVEEMMAMMFTEEQRQALESQD